MSIEATEEREAIVAWLRGFGGTRSRPSIFDYYQDQIGDYVHDLAAAIECGDHLMKGQDHE
jgi:hypothetical protein